MDKKTHEINEDTYEFTESDEADAVHFSTATASDSKRFNLFEYINRRTVLAGCVFILLVVGTYKLLSNAVVRINKSPVAEKSKLVANTIENPPQRSVVLKPDDTITRLKDLAQQQRDVQTSVQSFQSDLSDIQASLANLSTQLAQLQDEVVSLQTGQETLIQHQAKSVKPDSVKKEVPQAIYYVRAMIPGRVWLITPEGNTLTLGVGDKLVGYGNVESINVEQGVVSFSSGAMIGYSPNDR